LAPTNGDIPAYSDLPTHFQPQYITALGDQMGIMVTRVNPSLGTNKWDFTNYTGADWGFSCAYGLENVTSPFSTYSTYKGLYVYSMTGSNQ
jgi:hypothetical protein